MKSLPHENSSSTTAELKSAELVILLDGLRIDPASLLQSRELLGEASSAQTPLHEGVRARIRMRSNPEVMRSMLRSQSLRVSFLCLFLYCALPQWNLAPFIYYVCYLHRGLMLCVLRWNRFVLIIPIH